jgi:ubiquitin-like-specific protease 1C/D
LELETSDDEEDTQIGGTGSTCNLSGSDQTILLHSCNTIAKRMEGHKVAYPSRDDPEAVEIVHSDLLRLAPEEFLNDTVIDFYIKYIQRPEALTLEDKKRFHFFNSFFYKKLSEVIRGKKKKGGGDFLKLRKWTKGMNIFEKDYLFVPIHNSYTLTLSCKINKAFLNLFYVNCVPYACFEEGCAK